MVLDILADESQSSDKIFDSVKLKMEVREAKDLTDEQYELLIELDEKFSP